jgi:hypothetical protein
MPVDPLSRYRSEAPHVACDRDGVEHSTVPAHWTPETPARGLVYHTLAAGESYETLADRYLGSSAQWWRIADANPRLFPFDLAPGTVVAIPSLGVQPGPTRSRDW